jgi:glycosyltransferase involved in cell wall biosynthesis
MLKNSPLISIVIPCYNDAKYIEQSVLSALNQTYSNKEVIVVDDGSNAVTKAVLKKIEPTITKLITQSNQGQSTARNIGIKAAKGDYILVLDSDDFFEPTFCEKALFFFETNLSVKLVICYMNRIYDDTVKDVFKPQGGIVSNFILGNCAIGSAMFKKLDFFMTNGYDQKMTNGFEDWEFYIRLLKEGGSAYVIPELLFNYRLKENSTTTRANLMKYELLQYIYTKHQELYKNHFDIFVSHLLSKVEREEMEKIKNTERLEFLIGKRILQPFRWFKLFLK